jgi:hypothetical protein
VSPRIFPSTDKSEKRPVEPNPNGSRVFRVTDRTIDQRTRLILAADAESAVEPDAMEISPLGRVTTHEVTECVEFVPGDEVYRTASERVE